MSLSAKAKYSDKIVEPNQLLEQLGPLRGAGNKLVTINGSYDLLHPGHLEILFQAKSQGDVLIVLLNTDRSIQSYKDPNRPINPLADRMHMIAALEMVDFVSFFDELDPRVILEKIRPDVHANGREYGKDCIEKETVEKHGGRIHIVELVPGYSTTNLLKKMKQLCV